MSETGEVTPKDQAKRVAENQAKSGATGKGISRRSFLKGALGFGLGLLLGGDSAGPAPSTSQESSAEREKIPPILILDIFDIESFKDKAIVDYLQGKSYSEDEALGKMGIVDPSTLEGLKTGVPKDEEETFIFMLNALVRYWAIHGEDVVGVGQKAAEYFGSTLGSVHKYSIVDSVSVGRIEYDELGNPTLWLRIDPKKVAEKLSLTQGPIVNMSFEVGEVGFKYWLYDKKVNHPDRTVGSEITIEGITTYTDNIGNPISKEEYDRLSAIKPERVVVLMDIRHREFQPQDAYIKERAGENLSNIAEMASSHKDRIFVAVAGNPNVVGDGWEFPDIREARADLVNEGKWPDNLFMVGVYGYENGAEGPAAIGADFYVDQKQMGDLLDVPAVASFATPIVTEIVGKLYSEGVKNPTEIRSALIQLCDNKGDEESPLWVLSFKKVKNRF